MDMRRQCPNRNKLCPEFTDKDRNAQIKSDPVMHPVIMKYTVHNHIGLYLHISDFIGEFWTRFVRIRDFIREKVDYRYTRIAKVNGSVIAWDNYFNRLRISIDKTQSAFVFV